jgi:thioester reductase-like protein
LERVGYRKKGKAFMVILKQFLEKTEGKITCLIRGGTDGTAEERI